jgi:hypothetical protein
MRRWKREYLSTTNKVILADTLSPTFVGCTFQVTTIKGGHSELDVLDKLKSKVGIAGCTFQVTKIKGEHHRTGKAIQVANIKGGHLGLHLTRTKLKG